VSMKIYIATRLGNAAGHNALRDELLRRGHSITYDWTVHGSVQKDGPARIAEVALREIGGILDADLVVVLLPGGRGTHAELGIAVGLMKPILLVGEPEAFRENGVECAFYYAPTVRRLEIGFRSSAEDVAEAVDRLDS